MYASYQALGGHKAAHNNVNNVAYIDRSEEQQEAEPPSAPAPAEPEGFACKDCGKTFGTPQALGGHRGGNRCRAPAASDPPKASGAAPPASPSSATTSSSSSTTAAAATTPATSSSSSAAPAVAAAAAASVPLGNPGSSSSSSSGGPALGQKRPRDAEGSEGGSEGRPEKLPLVALAPPTLLAHPGPVFTASDIRPLNINHFLGPSSTMSYLGSTPNVDHVQEWYTHTRGEMLRTRSNRGGV